MVQIIVGKPVDEMEEPYVPSVVRKCHRCQGDVWIDEKIIEHFGDGMVVMCMRCVKDLGWKLDGEVAS